MGVFALSSKSLRITTPSLLKGVLRDDDLLTGIFETISALNFANAFSVGCLKDVLATRKLSGVEGGRFVNFGAKKKKREREEKKGQRGLLFVYPTSWLAYPLELHA